MSRCQHSQQISQFCLNESCSWRECSGCEQCMKKYHNHININTPSTSDTLSLNRLEDMFKLFVTKPETKPKSKILQQAVYNYFIIMKSQISTSLDTLSRIITNRLNYPYLNEEGHLNVYRKIKNKQYKKITKKQLKSFCAFSNTQNKDIVQLNEMKLYREEVKLLGNTMRNINQSFIGYAKAVEKLDNSFNVEKSFLNKIFEIIGSVDDNNIKADQKSDEASRSCEKVPTATQQSSNSKFSQQAEKKLNKDNNTLVFSQMPTRTVPLNLELPLKGKQTRDRKVSLDYSLAGGLDLVNKFRTQPTGTPQSNSSNIDENERLIYQRKKKLYDMINNPQQPEQQAQIPAQNASKSIEKTLVNRSQHENKQRQQTKNQQNVLKQQQKQNQTSLQNTSLKKSQMGIHAHVHMQQQKQIEIPSPIQEHEDELMPQSAPSYKQEDMTPSRTAEDDQLKQFKLQNKLSNSQPQKIQNQQKHQVDYHRSEHHESLLQKQKAQLFEDLMSKGINLPEIILHTILPRQTSRPKLYEDSKDVKERKITIPVKKFQEEEENFSPLLRERKQKKLQKQQQDQMRKEGGGKQMGKISLFDNRDGVDEIKEEVAGDKSEQKDTAFDTPTKQDQKLLLKQKQADSLALLVESLPLTAEQAIPLLEASIKYAHNNLSAAQYLSYLYLCISKPKQCLQLCNKFLQQLQDSPQSNELSIHLNNNKAAALNMLGRYSESIGILEKCLNHSKRDIYYKNLGDAYFSIGIHQKAILNYESAIRLNSQMDEALYNLSVCYYLQEHLHEAKYNVEKALKINSKSQDYLRLSREILVRMQQV